MENYVSAQLLSFLQSILLGLLCGMLYHLLRTLRTMKLRAAWLMHTLDGIYAVLFLLALFLLALQQGDGELRLYMLLGVALGLGTPPFPRSPSARTSSAPDALRPRPLPRSPRLRGHACRRW